VSARVLQTCSQDSLSLIRYHVAADSAGAVAAAAPFPCCSREAVDLTADGGLAQLAQGLADGTSFEGYGPGQLLLGGCRVVGLLRDGQPVQEVAGEGERALQRW
jgi:hypothetical protein